jgi:hypothetical protein
MKKNRSGVTFIEFLVLIVLLLFAVVGGLVITGSIMSKQSSSKSQITATQVEVAAEAQRVGDLVQGQLDTQRDQRALEVKLNQIRDFGHGIYKFPFVGDEFPEMLSKFLDVHTNLEPIVGFDDGTVRGVGAARFSEFSGHTVIFREKPKP